MRNIVGALPSVAIVFDRLMPSYSHNETYIRIYNMPYLTSICTSGLFNRSVQNQLRN
jgi:hypothetical protein